MGVPPFVLSCSGPDPRASGWNSHRGPRPNRNAPHESGSIIESANPEGRGLLDLTQFIYWLAATVRRDSKGQGLAEYALILALIAIVVIGAVIFLGGQINTIMSKVGKSI